LLGYILHSFANPMARFWLATSGQSWRHLPTPSDAPLVHSPGADPDRVLLVGSGIAVGYGVVSHDLALGGHLARELSTATGRGATVKVIGRRDMAPANTRTTLAGLDLARFDAIVLTLGGLEALTLMPSSRWREQLRELLLDLRGAPSGLKVFVVENGVPLLDGLPLVVRSLVLGHVRRLNRVSAALAAEFENVTVVRFDPARGDVSTLAGRTTYSGWAEIIAPAVAVALGSSGRAARTVTMDEESRLEALHGLELDSVPSNELDLIVANARDLFGMTGASVTIIDREEQHTKAAIGMPRTSIPRAWSMCDLTVRGGALFVVEDTMADDRIADLPWATGERVRFYAGYPVESPDGQRIGALCVVDTQPRVFSNRDAALLRDLALRVQSVLWGNRIAL